jgi:hypothetical protein
MSDETATSTKLVLTIEEFDGGLSFKAEGNISARCVPTMVNLLGEFCFNMVSVYGRDDGSYDITLTNIPKASNLH